VVRIAVGDRIVLAFDRTDADAAERKMPVSIAALRTTSSIFAMSTRKSGLAEYSMVKWGMARSLRSGAWNERLQKGRKRVGSKTLNMLNDSDQILLPHAASQTLVERERMARKKSPKTFDLGAAAAPARRVPMREFSRSLPMSLLRAREAVMRQFRPSLREHGLTEQQWRILRALSGVDAVEVTELARTAFLLGPSLSRILRDLEARRLIERRAAKTDLRRFMVSISDKGLKLMERVAPTSEQIYAMITRRYGARRLAELQDMLGELEASLAGLEIVGDLEPED
jgi:homoprotocatechuate degradation regulator HpaR